MKTKLPILATFAVLLLFSCDPPKSSDDETPQQKILRAVERQDKKTFYKGDNFNRGDNIVLVAPGGPEFELPPLGKMIESDRYSRIMVKQEQMIRNLPTDRVITDVEAREINLYSAARLYALAKDFKAKGHKVSLYSRSFGSLIVPEMLRQYGDEPFTKIFIAVGRLDMPLAIVDGFADDQLKKFQDGTTVIDNPVQLDDLISQAKTIPNFCNLPNRKPLPDDLKEAASIAKAICNGDSIDAQKTTAFKFTLRSGMRLQANIARNRYTELLKDKDLGKITYYFGGLDSRVGRLTNAEVRFLTGRTTFNVSSPSGLGHSVTDFTQTFDDGSTSARKMHRITGASGKHATVKFDLLAGHFPLPTQTIADIATSFGP